MAITTSYDWIKEKFNPSYWKNIEEFEEFRLRWISETRQDTNYYTDKNGVERAIQPINHFPKLKEYEVWMEGFAATGESSGASLQGKAMARNFGQACHIVMCTTQLKYIEKQNDPNNKDYVNASRWDYNPNEFSYWGCGLYWSEALAKRTFG